MKKYIQTKQPKLNSITCDVCKREFKTIEDMQNIISISHTCGYYSKIFEDGDIFNIDICEKCFVKPFKKHIKITGNIWGN